MSTKQYFREVMLVFHFIKLSKESSCSVKQKMKLTHFKNQEPFLFSKFELLNSACGLSACVYNTVKPVLSTHVDTLRENSSVRCSLDAGIFQLET